jgi:hypothetical protein
MTRRASLSGVIVSVQVMTWVFEHSPHKGNELLCLLAIADHAAIDGTNAFPSMATLAQRCRISVRQVVRIIARLEDAGAITINRSSGRHSNVYTVLMAVANSDISRTNHDTAMSPLQTVNSDISDTPNSDTVTSPFTPPTVTFPTLNSDISSTNSDIAVSPEPIEPKTEQKPRVLSHSLRERPRDELFDALLECWLPGQASAALTKPERGKLNAAVGALRAVNATADEIRSRWEAMRVKFASSDFCTPNALVNHWNSLGRTQTHDRPSREARQPGAHQRGTTEPQFDPIALTTYRPRGTRHASRPDRAAG